MATLATSTWAPPGDQPQAEGGAPIVLLHGFTQSGAAWGELATSLAATHPVRTVDLPGHGASADVTAGLWEGADLIALAGGPADYVGYSLGGRFALHLALAHPDVVRRLVLVSASAGMDTEAERTARRASDAALADRVLAEGVPEFVRWWLSLPLFATLPASAAALDSRLGGSASGLASSLRLAGAGTQEPLWDRLATLEIPVLVIAGGLDRPYVERGRRMAAAIGPNARFTEIPGAGHACHLERPGAWLSLVAPFLAGS